MTKWIDNLKPGDTVAVVEYGKARIRTVERVTKTLVVLVNGSRFRRSDGLTPGESMWRQAYLADPSDPTIRIQLLQDRRNQLVVRAQRSGRDIPLQATPGDLLRAAERISSLADKIRLLDEQIDEIREES